MRSNRTNNRTIKLVYAALFAALVFVGTQFIRVPLPFGYFNMGDCFVILSAILIGCPYAVIASALGAAFADVLSGFVIYAPATALIKSLMVVAVILMSKLCKNKNKKTDTIILTVGAVIAEIIMTAGYFAYDSLIYSVGGAIACLPGNIVQAVVAVVASMTLISLFEYSNILKHIKL